MEPTRVDIPGVGVVEFPDSMSSDEVNAAAAKLYQDHQPKPSDSEALGLAALRPATSLVTDMATNPAFPKATATAGRIIGGLAPVIGGGSKYGLGGAAMGLAGSAQGSWAGGKTGYFTGKMLQSMAMPVAKGMNAMAPYVGPLTVASGASDLAQMAEPTRKDIGTFGVTLGDTHDPEHPALLNLIAQKIRERLMGQR